VPTVANEIGSFLDWFLTTQLNLEGIPGAAVAVVRDGEVLHLGGYGTANLASGQPVSAATTLFRTGSVSKLLTWTAAMQLVEQGTLDLHADVNRYLSTFEVPPTYSNPVTLAGLMTHTEGFEDRAFGFYARSSAELVPLEQLLSARMPARIFPPGEVSAYSNYGAALAGHLVERASGLTFESYVGSRILTPLGMTSSSFRQPLPPGLGKRLATGYRASLAPGDFQWDLAVPAGALTSTDLDMARFMIAHLEQGRLGNARLLEPETIAAMHRRQFTNHPAVAGLTYGFQELRIAGRRILAQPGDMLHFTAALFMLPEEGLGLFVAYNRGRAAQAPMDLLGAFLARLSPPPPSTLDPPPPIEERDVGRFAGSYRSTRRNETSLEKLQELFSPVEVAALGPGTLRVSGLVVPESVWVETAPGVFRARHSRELIAFREDTGGRVTHLFEGNFPAAGYTRLPWYGSPRIHYGLLAVSVLLFLLTPIAWSSAGLRSPAALAPLAHRARRARQVAGAMCTLNLVFLAGMVVVIARGGELLFGMTPFARGVLLLPLVSVVLTSLTLIFAALAVGRRYWGIAGRLHYLLVALIGLAFLGSLHYWNLLGLQF
jgi:CubicO group peptidase (beta-lactamase class C family)